MLEVFYQVGFGNFGNFLSNLDQLGLFSYVLPFLLIFAMTYAILTQVPIFKENKGAGVLIAFALGLLALQTPAVSYFFAELTPNLAIALSLILAALILAGIFIKDTTSFKWIFFGIGIIAFIIVLITSLSNVNFIGSYWWNEYASLIVVIFLIVGAIVGVILSQK